MMIIFLSILIALMVHGKTSCVQLTFNLSVLGKNADFVSCQELDKKPLTTYTSDCYM